VFAFSVSFEKLLGNSVVSLRVQVSANGGKVSADFGDFSAVFLKEKVGLADGEDMILKKS
jgi:hypothetical protein